MEPHCYGRAVRRSGRWALSIGVAHVPMQGVRLGRFELRSESAMLGKQVADETARILEYQRARDANLNMQAFLAE